MSLLQKPIDEILPVDYETMLDKLNFIPRIEVLNKTIIKEAR